MLSTQPQVPSNIKNGKASYSFAAEPKGIESKRKIRTGANEADQKNLNSVNIMYDRRIHRGNTYASPAVAATTIDPLELQKLQEHKRKVRAKRKAENRRTARTPEPVTGRRHVDIQTVIYLEELSDKVTEAIAMTQTDAFIDRAPSPVFVPQKSGLDFATQIYNGDLFDFDFEVGPILDILVGKTLEQALIEVNEEIELAEIRAHHALRNAEYAEIQRLEDAERRRTEEKERRVKEQIQIAKEKSETGEKVAARAFSKSYLQTLIPVVLDDLSTNGYFVEKVQREIDAQTLPWLSLEVNKGIRKIQTARSLLDNIIKSAITLSRQ